MVIIGKHGLLKKNSIIVYRILQVLINPPAGFQRYTLSAIQRRNKSSVLRDDDTFAGKI